MMRDNYQNNEKAPISEIDLQYLINKQNISPTFFDSRDENISSRTTSPTFFDPSESIPSRSTEPTIWSRVIDIIDELTCCALR